MKMDCSQIPTHRLSLSDIKTCDHGGARFFPLMIVGLLCMMALIFSWVFLYATSDFNVGFDEEDNVNSKKMGLRNALIATGGIITLGGGLLVLIWFRAPHWHMNGMIKEWKTHQRHKKMLADDGLSTAEINRVMDKHWIEQQKLAAKRTPRRFSSSSHHHL